MTALYRYIRKLRVRKEEKSLSSAITGKGLALQIIKMEVERKVNSKICITRLL